MSSSSRCVIADKSSASVELRKFKASGRFEDLIKCSPDSQTCRRRLRTVFYFVWNDLHNANDPHPRSLTDARVSQGNAYLGAKCTIGVLWRDAARDDAVEREFQEGLNWG